MKGAGVGLGKKEGSGGQQWGLIMSQSRKSSKSKVFGVWEIEIIIHSIGQQSRRFLFFLFLKCFLNVFYFFYYSQMAN